MESENESVKFLVMNAEVESSSINKNKYSGYFERWNVVTCFYLGNDEDWCSLKLINKEVFFARKKKFPSVTGGSVRGPFVSDNTD